jgi:DNA-directed RNA polymerase subunit E'/Rpb7
MKKNLIIGEIYLSPSELNENFYEIIKKKTVTKYEKISFETIGYITEVLFPITIHDSVIKSDYIKINISFYAIVFQPGKGVKLTAEIQVIFNHGIFCFFENLKILIPTNTLKNFRLEGNKLHSIEKKEKILCTGDKIEVKLTEYRYEKKQFSCIGILIDS